MRLLVAADGLPRAKRAVEFAARFAGELREAEIILVNVGHIPVLTFAAPNAMAYVDLTRLEEALEQTGQQILGRRDEDVCRSQCFGQSSVSQW